MLVGIGCTAAVCNGLALPLFTVLFKSLIDSGFNTLSGKSVDQVTEIAMQFLYLSIVLFACGTLSSGCLLWSAARQGVSMRRQYMQSILRQEMAWFDTTKTAEITTSIERDCANVQVAIGEKL